MCPSLGCGVQGRGVDCLCVSPSIQTVTDQRAHPLIASNAPFCPSQSLWMWESLLCFSPAAPGCWSCPACPPPSPFSPSSLPNHAWVYTILSGGQGLLLVFSQCSVTTVLSVDVFLMHLWREMHSMSTYFSTILVPAQWHFWRGKPTSKYRALVLDSRRSKADLTYKLLSVCLNLQATWRTDIDTRPCFT